MCRVLAALPGGQLVYRGVYLLPHADSAVRGAYINLEVSSPSNVTLLIRLSPRHFIPTTLDSGGTWELQYARDVLVGAGVRVAPNPAAQQAVVGRVLRKSVTIEQGQFNPFVEVRRHGGLWLCMRCHVEPGCGSLTSGQYTAAGRDNFSGWCAGL